MWEDPIVAEVRRVREELAARFNFDVKAIFEDMRKRETELGDRLVTRKKGTEPMRGSELALPSTPVVKSDSASVVQGN
jgi:hypothetical protein